MMEPADDSRFSYGPSMLAGRMHRVLGASTLAPGQAEQIYYEDLLPFERVLEPPSGSLMSLRLAIGRLQAMRAREEGYRVAVIREVESRRVLIDDLIVTIEEEAERRSRPLPAIGEPGPSRIARRNEPAAVRNVGGEELTEKGPDEMNQD
jgi:hypothetical protein